MAITAVASVVQALPEQPDFAAWADHLDKLQARISPHFYRLESRRRVLAYLKGLLSDTKRKNGWQLAEQAGELTPDGMQRFLNLAVWDADAVRDELRSYVIEHLGHSHSVAVIDETGFLKQGKRSVGVQRQYSGTAGRIENCQVAVFLSYGTTKGFCFIDRELYLPREWTEDPLRCRQAGVPDAVRFATKPQLARSMLRRAHQAGVRFGWVSADTVYGGDKELRVWLEEQRQAYVLAVACTQKVCVQTEDGPRRLATEQVLAIVGGTWHRLSCGEGAKGPREYDWSWVALNESAPGGFGRWLLVRRSIAKPLELSYYLVSAPEATTLQQTVSVAGSRWSIEVGFAQTKDELGLDQYQVRRWDAWYRHITLVLLAQALLCVIRLQAIAESEQKRRT